MESTPEKISVTEDLDVIDQLINRGNYRQATQKIEEFTEITTTSVQSFDDRRDIQLATIKYELGDYKTARNLIENLNGKTLNVDDRLKSSILHIAILNGFGDLRKAKDVFTEAKKFLSDVETNKKRKYSMQLQNVHARTLQLMGNLDEASPLVDDILGTQAESDDVSDLANSYHMKATLLWMQGKIDNAFENYEISLDLRLKVGNKQYIAITLNNMGNMYWSKGELDKAMYYYRASLKMREEIGNEQYIASSLNNIGLIQFEKGNLDTALEYYLKALDIKKEIGNQQYIASSMNNIGEIYTEKGELDIAQEYYEKSLEISQLQENKRDIAISMKHLAKVYSLRLQPQQAISLYLQSEQYQYQSSFGIIHEETYFELFREYLQLSDTENAELYLDKLRALDDVRQTSKTRAFYKIAQAIHLKSMGTRTGLDQAKIVLQDIIELDSTHYSVNFLSLLNYCEILIQDTDNEHQYDISHEIIDTVARIYKNSQNQNRFPLLIHSLIIQAKVAMIQFNFHLVEKLLQQSLILTEEQKLPQLMAWIEAEIEHYSSNLNVWHDLYTQKAPLSQRMEIADLDDYLSSVGKVIQMNS